MANTGQLARDEARRWIGTPYRHQASCRGGGTDCLGLIRGVWRALYGTEPMCVPPYTMDWSEVRQQEVLWQAAAQHLMRKPWEDVAPGNVLLFRMKAGAVAKHMGICGTAGSAVTVIHAYGGHAVVESPLSLPWRRRLVACFAFPDAVAATSAPKLETNKWQR